MKGKEGRKEEKEEKEKIESDCAPRARPVILEILRRDSAIYLCCTSERVQQNTIGETGQRRVKKWWRRRWGRWGEEGEEEEESRRSTRKEMEEKAREDEKDVEVMAMVVEVSGGLRGGVFTKSQAESAAPFVDATDGDGEGGRGSQGENEEDGGGERTETQGIAAHERRERADDLGDDTTKNQMHGHWLFSIRIIGFPGRRSSESPRPSRYPFSLSVSLLRSLLLRIVRPRLPCLRRRHRCRLLRRASLAAAAAAATAPRLGGMGAGEKGRKNFEKKIQFRCHGDRRALTLIKIPRTSHLRRHRRHRRRPLVLFHRLVLRPLRSPLLPSPAFPATGYDAVAFAVSPIV